MLIDTLVEFGLSKKESEVYLALLQLEIAGAGELAQKTKINRSSVYVVLKSLTEKGFVSEIVPITESQEQRFSVTTPETLLKNAKDRVEKVKMMEKNIESILPELKALHKETRHRPKVSIYEGEKAIRMGVYEIFKEQANKGMKICRLYGYLPDPKLLPLGYEIKDDVALIKNYEVEMKIISPQTPQIEKIIETYLKEGYPNEFVVIPKEKFNKSNINLPSFAIYEDKVEFFSQDTFLVVIESKEIAETLKNIFDLAWEDAQKNSKEY